MRSVTCQHLCQQPEADVHDVELQTSAWQASWPHSTAERQAGVALACQIMHAAGWQATLGNKPNTINKLTHCCPCLSTRLHNQWALAQHKALLQGPRGCLPAGGAIQQGVVRPTTSLVAAAGARHTGGRSVPWAMFMMGCVPFSLQTLAGQ